MTSLPSQQTLLVTGGAGFIGSCFVAQAVQKGMRVIVLDALTYAGNRANLDWITPTPGDWQLVEGSIADRELVSRLLREHAITQVVNFAAESHVDNSIAKPGTFIDTNILGVFNLLEACRDYYAALAAEAKKDFRFVQISTDEVYGSLGPSGYFSESSQLHPNSPYSASKASGDHLAMAWFETYKLPVVITHCSNNYGPRQHPEKLIPNMIRCALAGNALPVYGDGKNIRDWIHVEDHCNGVWLAMEQGKLGQCYNFGGGEEVENLTLVTTICGILDRLRPLPSGSYTQQIAFVTDRLGHDRRYAVDSGKSQRELGWKTQRKLEQALQATVEWYLGNQDWCKTILESRK